MFVIDVLRNCWKAKKVVFWGSLGFTAIEKALGIASGFLTVTDIIKRIKEKV